MAGGCLCCRAGQMCPHVEARCGLNVLASTSLCHLNICSPDGGCLVRIRGCGLSERLGYSPVSPNIGITGPFFSPCFSGLSTGRILLAPALRKLCHTERSAGDGGALLADTCDPRPCDGVRGRLSLIKGQSGKPVLHSEFWPQDTKERLGR